LTGGRLHAQTAPAAPEVKEVVIHNLGEGSIDEGFVRAHMTIGVGEPFDHRAIARDTKALLDLEQFSHVSVSAKPIEGGLRVIYSLRMRLLLCEPVQVFGTDHMRDSKIRDLLDLRKGDLFDEQVLAVGLRKVLAEYREAHYPWVDGTWHVSTEDCPPGQARVAIAIDEGPKTSVADISYVGNYSVPASAFRKAMGEQAWYNPVGWFTRHRFDRGELETGCLLLRDIYLSKGYLDAQVRLREPEIADDGRVFVTVDIDEGKLYHLNKLSVAGVTIFPEAEIRRRIQVRPGLPASMTALGASADAIRDYYGSRGYIRTRVRPILDPDPERGTVDVRFAIEEGTLTRIRDIDIRGNTRTRDKVIRRELLVYPGDVYNEVRVRNSERIVENLGFFSSVRSFAEATHHPDESDLVLEVEEKRTGQFMVGAGFSSIDKLIGFIEVSQGNFDINGWPYFTGAGQKVKVRAQFGSRRKNYQLTFVEPWFMDRKLLFGIDLYRSEYDYSEFDVQRTGAAIKLGKSLGGPNRINFQYRLEEVSLSDYDSTNTYVDVDTGAPVSFDQPDTIKSSLRVSLTRDTRNNPFVPTSGNRTIVFGEMAGGPLGFDVDLYSAGIRVNQYIPLWFDHVLSLRGRLEMVEPFGDTSELPIAERLFIGGGRTIRGFDYRDVGPKAVRDPNDGGHRPYGGQRLALLSAEYTVPIVPNVRIATFYDVGNVWHDRFELDGPLASGAGIGLRLDVPGFPIRIDRAWVLEKDHELTDEDVWVFWIGYDP